MAEPDPHSAYYDAAEYVRQSVCVCMSPLSYPVTSSTLLDMLALSPNSWYN